MATRRWRTSGSSYVLKTFSQYVTQIKSPQEATGQIRVVYSVHQLVFSITTLNGEGANPEYVYSWGRVEWGKNFFLKPSLSRCFGP